jgi:hypothetical protein
MAREASMDRVVESLTREAAKVVVQREREGVPRAIIIRESLITMTHRTEWMMDMETMVILGGLTNFVTRRRVERYQRGGDEGLKECSGGPQYSERLWQTNVRQRFMST